ncbi:MAG TPA: hypothetical protein VNZ53_18065, partial [Steroidobacteraceae bacterium]|nr:hypothetical protein [Steroidobacteraceae bacterium]
IGGHAGRILLEPDALHVISPLGSFPLGLPACWHGTGYLGAILSIATADGKRRRALPLSVTEKCRSDRQKR